MSNGNETWMPLYIGDYLGDTMELDGAQHGAYLLLLMYYWRNGPLPIDDAKLAQIARTDIRVWKKTVGPVVRAFFTQVDGRLHQKRADLELERAREKCARAVEQRQADNQRLKAWRAKTGQDGGRPPPKPNGHAPEDETRFTGVSPPFQEAFRNRLETPAETGLKPVVQEPESQVQPEREERRFKSNPLISPVLARVAAACETPPDGTYGAEPKPTALQLATKTVVEKLGRKLESSGKIPSGKRAQRTAIEQASAVLYGEILDDDRQEPFHRGPVDPQRTVAEQLAALGFPHLVEARPP